MGKRIGNQTIAFANPPAIIATASIVGPKEGQGPLGDLFDKVVQDPLYNEKSWERAESKFFQEAVQMAVQKSGYQLSDMQVLLAGDLLNQIISSNFAARELDIPFIGLYGACSTMAESLAMAAVMVDGGFADLAVAAVSSHNLTAERQYRFPTEQGVQRPPFAQWTVTGAGAAVVSSQGGGPRITHATIGRVIDMGIKNPNEMGAAMAPAAADTIYTHLQDTGRQPQDYDLIITGDLAKIGRDITIELLKQKGLDVSHNFNDCGILIFDESQDVHAGGSGCACSAVVACSKLIPEVKKGIHKRILFIATGALLSPISYQQGESIPCIAHAVVIENGKEGT